MFAIYMFDKGLLTWTNNEFLQITKKKTDNLIEKWQKSWKVTSQKGIFKISINIW